MLDRYGHFFCAMTRPAKTRSRAALKNSGESTSTSCVAVVGVSSNGVLVLGDVNQTCLSHERYESFNELGLRHQLIFKAF